MADEITALLKVHEYFHGIAEEALREVQARGKVVQFAAGDIVHQPEEIVDSVRFILRGRLKALKVDDAGRETLFHMVERGGQLGMMLGALRETVPVRVIALEPSTLLELDYEAAMDLTMAHPDLRRAWLKTFAGALRSREFGAVRKRAPMLLAFVHESPATRPIARRLVARLREIGENITVFSDSNEWHDLPNIRCQPWNVEGREMSPEEIRGKVAEWQDANRIVFDLPVALGSERAVRLLSLVDRAIYFVPASASDAAMARLRAIDVPGRGWRDKISIAWLLDAGTHAAPAIPNLRDFAVRDFKIAAAPPIHPLGLSMANGLERLVHDLRGVRIGVALGGGAARGMSHLGVLKGLEQNGIVVDMLAGTSAGAMTGIVYASGLDGDYSAHEFAMALRPSWFFRRLPRSNYWYLLSKYRRGHFDPMLRKYLHDWKLEQLAIPCFSVTVDLVSGNSVVRERGDAVHAVLESINLPVLSAPIVRNGQALIDGGLVNNIPADVLVSMGCNFVIAVSVTAKMEKEFCEIRPDGTTTGRRPSILPTILRSLLVQNHSLNAFGVQPADVVIEPDVRGFDLTEFMRAEELAAIGEAAAREQVPKIQQLLTRLDPHLFRF